MRGSKHENEIFFWKFTLLNAYTNIYNIEQKQNIYFTLSNDVSTQLMYLWIEALYSIIEIDKNWEIDKNVIKLSLK